MGKQPHISSSLTRFSFPLSSSYHHPSPRGSTMADQHYFILLQQTIEDTSSCTSSSTSRRQHPFTTHAPLETSVPVFNKDPGNRSTAAAANYQDSTIWWNLPGYLFYLRINQLFKQCGHHVDFSLQADSSLCTHSTKRAPWLSFWASLVIICIINHCMYK